MSSDDAAVLCLSYDEFRSLEDLFDEDARVIEFDVSLGSICSNYNLPLEKWIWPSPPTSCTITIRQPNRAAFMARAASMGISIDPHAFLDADVLEPHNELEVGSVLSERCPVCGQPDLIVVDTGSQQKMLRMVAEKLPLSLIAKPTALGGMKFYLGGEEAYGVRCGCCVSAFAMSDALKGKLLLLIVEN